MRGGPPDEVPAARRGERVDRGLAPGDRDRARRNARSRLRAARQGVLSSVGGDLERDAVFRIAHDGHLGLRKNLAGRERDGGFGGAEAEAVIERLAEFAAACTQPDGRRAFEAVMRVGDRFSGPGLQRLPDALLLANPEVTGAARILGPGGRELVNHEPETRNGIHNGRGFLLVRPASETTAKLSRGEVDNRDFAPSLLSLFGAGREAHHEGTSFFA